MMAAAVVAMVSLLIVGNTAAAMSSADHEAATATAGRVLSTEKCSCEGILPKEHVKVPCLCIPQCDHGFQTVTLQHVLGRKGGDTGLQPEVTMASICHDDVGVKLQWRVEDEVIVTENKWCRDGVCKHCGDSVWEVDTVEFYFSASLQDVRQNVSEIDISAVDNGLWPGWINNTNGYAPASNHMMGCGKISVERARTSVGWNANLSIPWELLNVAGTEPRPKVGRINFYRWNYGVFGASPAVGNMSAWTPTKCDGEESCNPPHVPRYFGVARFV